MDKHELYEKVKNEKNLEYEKQIAKKSAQIMMFAIIGVILVLFVINHIFDQPNYQLNIILFASLAAGHGFRAFKFKDKAFLASFILSVIAAVITFILYITELIG